jgi:hypothetical protein
MEKEKIEKEIKEVEKEIRKMHLRGDPINSWDVDTSEMKERLLRRKYRRLLEELKNASCSSPLERRCEAPGQRWLNSIQRH